MITNVERGMKCSVLSRYGGSYPRKSFELKELKSKKNREIILVIFRKCELTFFVLNSYLSDFFFFYI